MPFSDPSSALGHVRAPNANTELKDAIVAVVGPTGCGKTSFIKAAIGRELSAGYRPRGSPRKQPATTNVKAAQPCACGDYRVTLLDTPGFVAGFEHSFTAVLRAISGFLSGRYRLGTKLSGVIFMHRLFDACRISEKHSELLRRLCGTSDLSPLLIVTNIWALEGSPDLAGLRERVLQDSDFKLALEQGAQIANLRGVTPASTHDVLSQLLINSEALHADDHGMDSMQNKRDKEFYIDHEDMIKDTVVFRVQRTLFRVPRDMIPTLESKPLAWLGWTQGDGAVGGSDDNPIVIYGERAETFRNLLWALNAREDSLPTKPSRSDIRKFIGACHLGHKLGFKGLVVWAIKKLHDWSAQDTKAFDEDFDLAAAALEIAAVCKHDALINEVVQAMCSQLKGTPGDIGRYVALADRVAVPRLRGWAYYAALRLESCCYIRRSPLALATTDDLHSPQRLELTDLAQGSRLLRGHLYLVAAWEKIKSKPIQVKPARKCGAVAIGYGNCWNVWKRAWLHAVTTTAPYIANPFDVVENLQTLRSALLPQNRTCGITNAMCEDCHLAAGRAIDTFAIKFEDGLDRFFADASA